VGGGGFANLAFVHCTMVSGYYIPVKGPLKILMSMVRIMVQYCIINIFTKRMDALYSYIQYANKSE
jgi:hypothetical protein